MFLSVLQFLEKNFAFLHTKCEPHPQLRFFFFFPQRAQNSMESDINSVLQELIHSSTPQDPFFFFKFILLKKNSCVGLFCLQACKMYNMHTVPIEARSGYQILRNELRMAVSHRVDAGTGTQVFCKSRQCS